MKKPLIPLGSRSSFIKMRRDRIFWRMDRKTFSRFINYVTRYMECKELTEVEWRTILYAEIYCSDMTALSNLFGILDFEDELLLTELDYSPCGTIWNSPFCLYVCTETNGKQSIKKLYIN